MSDYVDWAEPWLYARQAMADFEDAMTNGKGDAVEALMRMKAHLRDVHIQLVNKAHSQ